MVNGQDTALTAKDSQNGQKQQKKKSRKGKCFKCGKPGQSVLGLRVQRDRAKRTLWIDQSHCIEETLRAFQFENCKGVSTLADGYDNVRATTTDEALFDDVHLYRQALGRLNWLVRGTRPDIAFVVHKLSQHC